MALTHVLLGLLETPASGYELGLRFEQTVGIFWSAELSQIYPTLHGLERDGMVTSEERPPRAGPARRVYRRTPAGVRRLETWLGEIPEPARPRIPWLARMFFLGQLRDLALIEESLRRLRGQFTQERERLVAIAAGKGAGEDGAGPGATAVRTSKESRRRPIEPTELSARLVLDAGIAVTEARIAWCDASLERVRGQIRETGREGAR